MPPISCLTETVRAAKSAGKEAIEMSALRTLGNLAAHVDLQVNAALWAATAKLSATG